MWAPLPKANEINILCALIDTCLVQGILLMLHLYNVIDYQYWQLNGCSQHCQGSSCYRINNTTAAAPWGKNPGVDIIWIL